jgi:hypothetical protein
VAQPPLHHRGRYALGPKDRVFLVGFGNHIRLVSDYSQSSAGMMASWKRYDKSSGRFPELGPREDRDLGTAFYDSIFYPSPKSSPRKMAAALSSSSATVKTTPVRTT